MKDENFTSAYDDYVKVIMSKSSGKALKTMLNLLNAKSEMVRFNAAKDILDRGGFMPTNKQEIDIKSVTFVDDVPLDDDD